MLRLRSFLVIGLLLGFGQANPVLCQVEDRNSHGVKRYEVQDDQKTKFKIDLPNRFNFDPKRSSPGDYYEFRSGPAESIYISINAGAEKDLGPILADALNGLKRGERVQFVQGKYEVWCCSRRTNVHYAGGRVTPTTFGYAWMASKGTKMRVIAIRYVSNRPIKEVLGVVASISKKFASEN